MASSYLTDNHERDLPLLEIRTLLDRIEVTAPYMALREVQVLAGSRLAARVDREYEMGLEGGVISMAEAGRHLAILGSVAAASLQPTDERHFYLAQRARILGFPPLPNRSGSARNLRAIAQATLERRSASASTQLALADGTPLFDMTVDYRVMRESVFRRIAPSTSAAPMADSARSDGPVLTLDDIDANATTARAQLTVDAADCQGHFPGCPALPVAKLMHALSLLSGAVLRAKGHSCSAVYVPLIAEIDAENLAFAGERLDLVAVLESHNAYLATTRVAATNDRGTRVGGARFTVRPCC